MKNEKISKSLLGNKRNKQYNDYYIVDNIVCIKNRTNNKSYICDIDDWERLKEYCWHDDGYGYASTIVGKKTIRLHQMIVECPKGMFIDHINGKHWDNRKCNLRVVTRQQNNINMPLRSNNTSGYKGVHWHKSRCKWMAYIKVQGKMMTKYCNNIEDAIEWRKQKEIEFFGEYSRDYGHLTGVA